mgnify:CR=1 FL=1
MFAAQLRIFAAVIFVLTLTGSQCAFVAWSGDRSSDDDEDDEDDAGLVVVIRDGRFIDAPVEGLHYMSGVLAGVTGPGGEFRYQNGSTVRFFIGDILLGEADRGKPVLTPLDLVANGDIDTPAVINIARLLQSLDAIPGDDAISIPAAMHNAAVRSNVALSHSIDYLDFRDDTAFVNAASQLIAVLTADYPFTASLVDPQTARHHLAANIEGGSKRPQAAKVRAGTSVLKTANMASSGAVMKRETRSVLA